MNKTPKPDSTILIASDSTPNAALVKKLLDAEFDPVMVSTHPDAAGADFDSQKPDVLVLAFDSLEKSERHNLGLFRQSQAIHQQPHRTIILCHKDEVHRAYELCRGALFDDYVLFWPVAQDASRLLMAVHHALRDLAAARRGGPRPAELVAPAQRLGELETLLGDEFKKGEAHLEVTGRTVAQAEQEIAAILARFSHSLKAGELADLVESRNGPALGQAFDRLRQESLAGPFQAVAEAVRPLKQWAEAFRRASEPHLESLRSLQALCETPQPTVLVVDDDGFQHQIVDRLLKDEGYRLVFATSGIEALNLLHKQVPDLVLMDLSMPEMDGLEVTRRMKGVARFASIPVVMITGNSEEAVVTQCLQAGAIDFMVKPLRGEALITKIAKILGSKKPSPVGSLPDVDSTDL